MVVTENILMEAIHTLESFNLPIPDWVFKIITVMLFLGLVYELILKRIFDFLKKCLSSIKAIFYTPEIERFIALRNIFVEHLDSEVKRLNRESDWNDFYYTQLEAEVEMDPSLDLDIHSTKNPIILIRSFFHVLVSSIGMSPTSKIQKNLIQAIKNSNSRAFLIIGEPGSGKTVSLRHLFVEMANKCITSRHKDDVVPVYLNLKHLNVEADIVDADKIHTWIVEELRSNQDRTILEFIDKNFEQMLKDGNFFFLFDSFDEIPAVMDAQEEQEVVRNYALALDRFLHSQHQCRGLVSSRPYRKPRTFIGQKMEIRPLSNKRIKKALYKYMGQDFTLANQIWRELVQSREDMLFVAQNPFYLGLLVRYSKENQRLPELHYDLFEHFVQSRANADEKWLNRFGLTPDELIAGSSVIAFSMTITPHIGLEANTKQLCEATKYAQNKLELLLHALAYSKLGRLSHEEPDRPRVFSFVHRRFHEYFCALYLKKNLNIAPFENLSADDRWREILVLLCEVISKDNLIRIFDIARSSFAGGINANRGTIDYRKAIETMRVLREGFHNRIEDIPIDIRALCSKFIKIELKLGNLLDKKRALEGITLSDDETVYSILETALNNDSAWLRETALRSCRILRKIPNQISIAIRNHLYYRYTEVKSHKDYNFYSILFSSSPKLHPFRSFLKILIGVTLIQFILIASLIFYAFSVDKGLLLRFIGGLMLGTIIYLNLKIYGENQRNEADMIQIRQIFIIFKTVKNPWIIFSFGVIIMSLLEIIITKIDSTFSIDTYILLLIIVTNIFIISLIYSYPDSIKGWILQIVRIIRNIPVSLLEVVKEYKIILKIFGALSPVLLIVIGLMLWIDYVLKLAAAQHYSITNIYSTYGIIIGLSAILTLLIIVLILVGGFLILLFGILKIIYELINIFQDSIRLKRLSFLSNARPTTTVEAIQILHLFKSYSGKTQYVEELSRWLPIGTDPQALIEESNKYHGVICDKLCQLAESWEDSMKRKV